jgi:hypothetical protein
MFKQFVPRWYLISFYLSKQYFVASRANIMLFYSGSWIPDWWWCLCQVEVPPPKKRLDPQRKGWIPAVDTKVWKSHKLRWTNIIVLLVYDNFWICNIALEVSNTVSAWLCHICLCCNYVSESVKVLHRKYVSFSLHSLWHYVTWGPIVWKPNSYANYRNSHLSC